MYPPYRYPTVSSELGISMLFPSGGRMLVCDYTPDRPPATPGLCAATVVTDAAAAAVATCHTVTFTTVRAPTAAAWALVKTSRGWTAYRVLPLRVVRVATDLPAVETLFLDDAGDRVVGR